MTSIFQEAAEAIGLADPDVIGELAQVGQEMAAISGKALSLYFRIPKPTVEFIANSAPHAWVKVLTLGQALEKASDDLQTQYEAAYDRILAERSAPKAAE